MLAMYMSALERIHAMKDTISVQGRNLINFAKYEQLAGIILEIQYYQSQPYNFTPVDSIASFLGHALADSYQHPLDYFHALSLKRERKE